MNIPILVETRKAVLEAEIKALESDGSDLGYRLGALAALGWILNGGRSPSELMRKANE